MKVNEALLHRYQLVTSVHRTEAHTSPSHWSYTKCEIFEHGDDEPEGAPGKKIGEFIYNYPSEKAPWHPFEQDGKHYALYSSDYTATRVMALPECTDLGGEEPHGFGFCPVGFAVPYFTYEWQPPDPTDPQPRDNPRHHPEIWAVKGPTGFYQYPDNKDYTGPRTKAEYEAAVKEFDKRNDAWNARHPYVTTPFNARFGFVCGCIWGDDTSWKIQFLDLSRISEGILTRDARFGYLELLGSSDNLAAAIDLDNWTPEEPNIYIAAQQHFRTNEEK